MAECGASGSGSSGDSLDKSITLPPDEIFRNLENAKRFAIDIGNRGRARGEGRREAGVGAGGGAGGPGAVARTKGGARAGGAHSLTGPVVCGLLARTASRAL